ncbi:hypothetical protein [Pseudobdellovibrio exovorus]|uniref:Uncharacterized protein n=1 Tax=Pseudobdellovibrio exovorus JSS TaxID=1184267 RepID=M4V9D0_9BACT|nr:hypothetical protein [Pseudobdellovibrio exovorus]AGH95982.1 hypothetical protein A11Q_1766 [Pseudobdellovibrio exovorus JSS]
MVHGLKHFADRLAEFKDHYVLVGGVAGDMLMDAIGGEFRATKDLDIVVFMKPDQNFLSALAVYIKEGEYENKEKSDGSPQFFRFNKPRKLEFPKQIELFSKKPEDLKLLEDQHIIPIQNIEAGTQFSGILLEDEYYDLIKSNAQDGENCKYITAVAQIPLKARAFNELRDRSARGISVDERDIRKHRNDILLFSAALPNGGAFKLTGLPQAHLAEYIRVVSEMETDIGIKDFCKQNNLGTLADVIASVKTFYL